MYIKRKKSAQSGAWLCNLSWAILVLPNQSFWVDWKTLTCGWIAINESTFSISFLHIHLRAFLCVFFTTSQRALLPLLFPLLVVCILIFITYIIPSTEKGKTAEGTTMFLIELIRGLDTIWLLHVMTFYVFT